MDIFIYSFLILWAILTFTQIYYNDKARAYLKPEYKGKLTVIFKFNHLYKEDEAYEDEEGLMYRDKAKKIERICFAVWIAWMAFAFIIMPIFFW